MSDETPEQRRQRENALALAALKDPTPENLAAAAQPLGNCERQHGRPCNECPFRRSVKPGALGGSPPEVYIGQANANFRIPCHSTHDYHDLEQRLAEDKPECAGAAIFRSNVGVAGRITDKLLHLPEDKATVFATFAEFHAHHYRAPLQLSEAFLADYPPAFFTRKALEAAERNARDGKASFKVIPKP